MQTNPKQNLHPIYTISHQAPPVHSSISTDLMQSGTNKGHLNVPGVQVLNGRQQYELNSGFDRPISFSPKEQGLFYLGSGCGEIKDGGDDEEEVQFKIIKTLSCNPYRTFGINLNPQSETIMPFIGEKTIQRPSQLSAEPKDTNLLDISYQSNYLQVKEEQVTYKVEYEDKKATKRQHNIVSKTLPSANNLTDDNEDVAYFGGHAMSYAHQDASQNHMEEEQRGGQGERQEENVMQTGSEFRGKEMEAQGIIKADSKNYQQVHFKISEKLFSIANVPIEMDNILKIKIFPSNTQVPKYCFLKISTTRIGEQLLVGLRRSSKFGIFPLPYYTFSKIIIKKLKSMKICHITSWTAPQHSPPQYFITKKEQFHESRENTRSKSKIDKNLTGLQKTNESPSKMTKSQKKFEQVRATGFNKYEIGNVCWKSDITVGKAKTFIHGRIYKKSKHLGNWEKRYIVINEVGIFSYHKKQDKHPTVKIERCNIRYIWSWFSIIIEKKQPKKLAVFFKKSPVLSEEDETYVTTEYDQRTILKNKVLREYLQSTDKYLIVKVKHGIREQTEFAIPICNFDTELCHKNWLYSFFKVLPVPAAVDKHAI